MNGLALKNLAQCTSSEVKYRHNPHFLFSAGVKYLVDHACAYWLLDIINSYQAQAQKDPMMEDFQIWRLCPGEWQGDRSKLMSYFAPTGEDGPIAAHVVAERDANQPAIVQQIAYTDFPFADMPEAKIYVIPSIDERGKNVSLAIVPSEY